MTAIKHDQLVNEDNDHYNLLIGMKILPLMIVDGTSTFTLRY